MDPTAARTRGNRNHAEDARLEEAYRATWWDFLGSNAFPSDVRSAGRDAMARSAPELARKRLAEGWDAGPSASSVRPAAHAKGLFPGTVRPCWWREGLGEGPGAEGRVDLSNIDFGKLATLFETSPKVAAERLRAEAEGKARKMAEMNPTRVDLVEKLEKLVADYNAGSIDAEKFFAALKDFVASLDKEEQRATREGLTEEELAIFDLLVVPEPKLTKAQTVEVKRIARELLAKLHAIIDAPDWKRGQEMRGAVYSEIRIRLNELPEEPYPKALWDAKVDQVWGFVLRRYADGDIVRAH